MNHYTTLEFDKILDQLADNAQSAAVKTRCLALVPSLNEAEVKRRMDETTQAKRIIEQIGTPPLPSMAELRKVIDLIGIDAMLIPDQIAHGKADGSGAAVKVKQGFVSGQSGIFTGK